VLDQQKKSLGFARSEVVAAGSLKSTDGIYGLRFAHNTDALITDLKLTKEP
jgi:hypothetical protein